MPDSTGAPEVAPATTRKYSVDGLPVAGERAVLTGEVIGLFLRVAHSLQQHVDNEFSQLGLSPAVARALQRLDADQPSPARDLAEQLACDRSNVTGLVDRLEEAGLVLRRIAATDRRVKTLVVTPSGRAMQREMQRVLDGYDAMLAGLADTELMTLREVCAKIIKRLSPRSHPAEVPPIP